MVKPGSFFALAKCIKNTWKSENLGKVIVFLNVTFLQLYKTYFASAKKLLDLIQFMLNSLKITGEGSHL